MRLNTQIGASAIRKALSEWGYPFDWSHEILTKHCLLTAIETPCGDLVGYVWFHWVAGADKVLDTHICINPKYRGKAFTARVIADLIVLAASCGARTLMARCTSYEDLNLVQRVGFRVIGPFSLLSINPLADTVPPPVARRVKDSQCRASFPTFSGVLPPPHPRR